MPKPLLHFKITPDKSDPLLIILVQRIIIDSDFDSRPKIRIQL